MSGILLMSVGNSYASAPANAVAPAITGAATVGQTLTTSNGTWTGSPAPTFTYQWQRTTTNIGGATSSTYVVQSADLNNTLRCVVTATNPIGVVSANSNNTAIVTNTIGAAFGGGFYAGQISTAGTGVADFNLVVGPVASAQSALNWKTSNTSGDPTSDITGPTNSAAMNSATYPAAQFCEAVNVGGFTDWYMPAKNELEVCYYNLKPTTTGNTTTVGANPNSVPIRTANYTSGTPAQTSAADFQSGGAQAFNAIFYWASTEAIPFPTYGRCQSFSFGNQTYVLKNNYPAFGVRAVRRVAV